MTNPVVSVIIASYNYETYVAEAVCSVLGQTFADLEVLAVDDGSTDDSLVVLHTLARNDARVRVITHPDGKNHGLPATLTLGLAHARGEFVAFLESDDQWRADCLQSRLTALQAAQQAAAVPGARQTDALPVDVVFNGVTPMPMPGADTGWFDSYVPRIMAEHAGRGNAPFRLDTALLLENKIPTFSCAMVRRTRLLDCDFDAPVPRWLDWWLWMQIACTARFCFVAQPLTLWRLHTASYNHAVRLHGYLADSRALWLGFRARFLNHFRKRSLWAFVLLNLPCQARLAARLALVATQSSPAETLRRIRSRLQ